MRSEGLSKDLTLEEFLRFRDFIHAASGIFLEDSKADSLRISLITRATRLNLGSLDEYYRILISNDAEFKELLNLITINETSFFRFPQQFEALTKTVLPEIMAAKPHSNRTIRVWSAGCSTGEEPYSIAMTLIDAGLLALGWRVQVLGTDVSTKALASASRGEYPKRALLNVPKDVIARHFEVEGDRARVAQHVRAIVEFGYHNLIKEPYPLSLMGNWDIIFCRNVTIYFKLESTRRVVANFFNSLNEGGYLFIGHSETLSSISDQFEPIEVNGVFLYRKPRTRKALFPGGGLDREERHAAHASAPGATSGGATRPDTGERVVTRPKRSEETRRPERARQAVTSTPRATATPSRGDLHARAKAAFEAGHREEVLDLVSQMLAMDPNDTDAHLLAAFVHADAGAYDAALQACQRALAVNPLLPAARYILGIIYQRQGDLVRAVSEFKKTIYIDAGFALAHLNLANIHKAERKWERAAREYENALRALYSDPQGEWTAFLGGFKADLLVKTCERSLLECRKAMGKASEDL